MSGSSNPLTLPNLNLIAQPQTSTVFSPPSLPLNLNQPSLFTVTPISAPAPTSFPTPVVTPLPINRPSNGMNVMPSSMNVLPSSMNGMPSSMNGMPSSMNGMPSSMNGMPSSMNGMALNGIGMNGMPSTNMTGMSPNGMNGNITAQPINGSKVPCPTTKPIKTSRKPSPIKKSRKPSPINEIIMPSPTTRPINGLTSPTTRPTSYPINGLTSPTNGSKGLQIAVNKKQFPVIPRKVQARMLKSLSLDQAEQLIYENDSLLICDTSCLPISLILPKHVCEDTVFVIKLTPDSKNLVAVQTRDEKILVVLQPTEALTHITRPKKTVEILTEEYAILKLKNRRWKLSVK